MLVIARNRAVDFAVIFEVEHMPMPVDPAGPLVAEQRDESAGLVEARTGPSGTLYSQPAANRPLPVRTRKRRDGNAIRNYTRIFNCERIQRNRHAKT